MMLEVTHVKQAIDVERNLRLNLSTCSVSTVFCKLGKFWSVLVTYCNYDKVYPINVLTLQYNRSGKCIVFIFHIVTIRLMGIFMQVNFNLTY